MCVQESLTFDEVVKVVKHLVFWGLGKLVYPLSPMSMFRLTNKVAKLPPVISEKF